MIAGCLNANVLVERSHSEIFVEEMPTSITYTFTNEYENDVEVQLHD